MTTKRNTLVKSVWRDQDPFLDFKPKEEDVDLQGWSSQHPYLTEAVDSDRPTSVLEVGVWKGASVVTMAKRMKELSIDGVVIAVDTWLGAYEHWLSDALFADLKTVHGYPNLYHTFATNMVWHDVADVVLPLPIDSLNAATVIERIGERPQLIHIDGGHSYESVMADLNAWWPLLAPGGLLIGDDYFTDGITWQGVKQAMDEFFGARGLGALENINGKCRVRKPA